MTTRAAVVAARSNRVPGVCPGEEVGMAYGPVSRFNDGVPVTIEEVASCEHPDLRSAYAIDGPV